MHKITFAVLMGLVVLALATKDVQASDTRLIGTYGDWMAYVFKENGNDVCYMASQPVKAEGNYTRRGDIYALVTHRPAEGTKNVFSYITGYPYKPSSDATVKVGSQRFSLFTQDETAWAPDSETDNKIAAAIKKGSNMVVTGMSARGTRTTDTFSLKGSSAAYEAMSRECGVK